jgi:EF-P beta-lysylation protein EpmB
MQLIPNDTPTALADAAAVPPAPGSKAGSDWKRLWRDAVRDPRELLALLDLNALGGRLSEAAAARLPLRVPRGFVARMRRGDPHDPLLRQVLPLDDEERLVPGFGLDAVGDAAARTATGVLQKYRGRALLVTTGACAVHCRYCFRRHFPYDEQTAIRDGWREALDAIARDDSIDEVILSGGDPLSLSTAKLAELTHGLAAIPRLRRLRIHSRLPVVLPERVDGDLLAWISGLRWPLAFVIHANHANEFDAGVDAALARLRGVGATLLNQAVLLRGVNDSADALAGLSERAYAAGVLPYYLHQLDRVAGTAHFEVSDAEAITVHAALAARLPGYLLPRLVRELPGDTGKRPLTA